MASSVSLELNTLDAVNASAGTPHDSQFAFQNMIHGGQARMTLNSCSIPNMRYNVHSLNNTLIYKKNGGAATTVTLTVGDYDQDSILDGGPGDGTGTGGIKSLLVGDFASVTVTLGATSDLITIATNTADTISIETGSTLASELLGFSLPVSAGTSITGSYPIRLDGSLYVDVCLREFPTQSYISGTHGGVIARIPLVSGYGTVVHWQNSHATNVITAPSEQFQQFSVYLVDDRGRQFILPANSYCSYDFLLDLNLNDEVMGYGY